MTAIDKAMRKDNQKTETRLAKYSRVAKKVIISNQRAEKFIARWMEANKTTRRIAIKKLRELGVRYPL